MKAQLTQDERRVIARRIFAALCTQYPDRYVALVEEPRRATMLAETAPKAPIAPSSRLKRIKRARTP